MDQNPPLSALFVNSAISLPELREQYTKYRLGVQNVAEDTVEEERIYLNRFFIHFGPPETASELFQSLEPARLHAFLIGYAQEYGPGSQRWMHMLLRSFLRFAYLCSYLEQDLSAVVPSVRKRKMGHIVRALPDESIAELESRIPRDTPAGLRDSAIVSLLNTYGVRGVQIRRLRLEHIDWQNRRIVFPAAKGGRLIEEYLHTRAGNRLAAYLTHARADAPHAEVFLTLSRPYTLLPSASYLSSVIRRHMKQLNIRPPPRVSRGTHGFRHAFATRMTGSIPFKDLVDLLGHRDPTSTLLYSKVDLTALREAALPWPGGDQ